MSGETTSKHHVDFWCLHCLRSFRTENKLKSYEKLCKHKSEKDYVKSDKMLYIIYADIESLTRKIDGCENNLEKSSTKKIGTYSKQIFNVYPYENIGDWEKFDETALLEKEEFCSNLNLEDIKNADYMYVKRVCKYFKTKNLWVNIMICILNVIHYF